MENAFCEACDVRATVVCEKCGKPFCPEDLAIHLARSLCGGPALHELIGYWIFRPFPKSERKEASLIHPS